MLHKHPSMPFLNPFRTIEIEYFVILSCCQISFRRPQLLKFKTRILVLEHLRHQVFKDKSYIAVKTQLFQICPLSVFFPVFAQLSQEFPRKGKFPIDPGCLNSSLSILDQCLTVNVLVLAMVVTYLSKS